MNKIWQWLICHKTQPTKETNIKNERSFITLDVFLNSLKRTIVHDKNTFCG